ncbi:MAG TPA: hypothetical protein VG013_33580 [Gemmataceae bacterium]|nr:hypothetical protein [Gemmataceae bacterium]
MTNPPMIGRRDHLTFKGNLRHTRYGWLRLTPAYSVHQVTELLGSANRDAVVLDPFCGTGTTALVCAEQGTACDTTDINPFLVWLATAKTRCYTDAEVNGFLSAAAAVSDAIRSTNGQPAWLPPLYQIDKWWDAKTLAALGHAVAKIKDLEGDVPGNAADLLKVAFCRTMMDHAHVSFGHQSMSFKKRKSSQTAATGLPGLIDHPVAATWGQVVPVIASAARLPVVRQPRVFLLDARNLDAQLETNRYTCVITSPPYPNRMSYIRELRPYMYWLDYLQTGRAAGELDWQAIGGTWGCATSNLATWKADAGPAVPFGEFGAILEKIAERSVLLSRYVHKYFHDMVGHTRALFRVVKPGGTVHYIVGNSKFYDVLLPVEAIYAGLFEAAGFRDASVRMIRKRTSKKELFEFVVSARKAGGVTRKAADKRPAARHARKEGGDGFPLFPGP